MAETAQGRDQNNEWLNFASSCMTDSKWEMAARRPEASLSHCTCPWGGHLVRFDNRNIFIQNAPEDPRDFLIRPEVRGLYEAKSEIAVHWRETLAPGEAVLERSSSMWVVKMASVLFGNFQGPLSNFFYDNLPTLARHQLRRDFPQPGDCTYVGQECLLLSRRERGSTCRYQVVLVFRTPEDRWAHWAWPFHPMITDMFHKAMIRFLNRLEVEEMREMDSQMYIVLCMRSFNRGPPMVPHSSGEVTITSGKENLASWTRFSAQSQGFCLAEYLKLFMSQLGHALTTYETLDCCKLVPYQCVVKRSDWERLREPFTQAFRLQKAAYRRANGGTTAPALLEDVKPHFSTRRHVHSGDLTAVVVKTVVRKTFLELEEDVEVGPPMRRTKSDVSDVISLL